MMYKSTLLTLASLLVFSGCAGDSTDRVIGESTEVGGLAAHSWALMDDAGTVTQVGFSVDREKAESMTIGVAIPLSLPAEVVEQTLFDHIQIDFMNEGHTPGPFLVPHFDFHFYTVTSDEILAVDCVDEPMPDESRMPAPYIIPDTAIDPTGTCVPAMGVHAINPTSPELAPESTTAFTEHFILGYHNGEMTFIEPMIAQSVLAAGTELSGDVPRPATYGKTTLYPATWSLALSADGTEYEVSFSDFSEIQ
jgi:hypothetical protein